MNTERADRARQERLTARAAKYHTQVERLRALAGLTPEPSPAPDADQHADQPREGANQ